MQFIGSIYGSRRTKDWYAWLRGHQAHQLGPDKSVHLSCTTRARSCSCPYALWGGTTTTSGACSRLRRLLLPPRAEGVSTRSGLQASLCEARHHDDLMAPHASLAQFACSSVLLRSSFYTLRSAHSLLNARMAQKCPQIAKSMCPEE